MNILHRLVFPNDFERIRMSLVFLETQTKWIENQADWELFNIILNYYTI